MPAPSPDPLDQPFELGSWRVEPGLDRISRGAESVPLEPRAMDLLRCLARRQGQTVSKETILDEVWGGVAVVEGVVPKTISALRAALGDDAAAPTYILTVPRRGYRLLAPLRETAPDLVAAGPLRVAGRGVPAGVEPPARPAEPRALSRRLFLAAIVLAAALAANWAVRSPEGGRPPAKSPPGETLPPGVETLLLEARHLWSKRGAESVRRANDLLLEAAKEAPDSAEVRGWLALSFVTRGNYLGSTRESFASAGEEVERALALDPDSAIANCAAGVLSINRDRDAETAERRLRHAFEVDPDLLAARQYLAEALSIQGKSDEAIAAIDGALEVDSLSPVLQGVRGLILLRSARPLAALEAFDRVLVLEPHFGWVHRDRAWALARLGREQEACEAFYLEARTTGEKPEHLATLRAAMDESGLPGYWRWRLDRLEAVRNAGILVRPMQYAEALAGVGRTPEALAAIEQAAAAQDGEYFFYFRDSQGFDRLRDDPRFRALYDGRRK